VEHKEDRPSKVFRDAALAQAQGWVSTVGDNLSIHGERGREGEGGGIYSNQTLVIAGSTFSNNAGGAVLQNYASSPVTMLPTGQPNKTVKSFVALNALRGTGGQGNGIAMASAAAQLVARIAFTDGSNSVVALRSDGAADEIASTGAAAPGLAETFSSFSTQTQSSDGRAAFLAALSQHGQAIFAEDSTHTLGEIVSAGAAAPGAGPAKFQTLSSPVNNDQGDVAWASTLSGAAALTRSGIWWRHGGQTALVAQTGTTAAGTQGLFQTFDSLAVSGGANGAPLVIGTLRRGTGDGTAANDHGLWAEDTAGQLRLLLRTSASLAIGGGAASTVKSFTIASVVPSSASPSPTPLETRSSPCRSRLRSDQSRRLLLASSARPLASSKRFDFPSLFDPTRGKSPPR
jgi:hypothetical protein